MKNEKRVERCEKALSELRSYSTRLEAARESQLVAAAQQGDVKATHALFHSIADLGVFKMQKKLVSREWINENEGELYLVFYKALQSFEPSRGYRFTTWFGNKIGFAAMDIVVTAQTYVQRFGTSLDEAVCDDAHEETAETKLDRKTEEDLALFRDSGDIEEKFALVPKGLELSAVLQLFPEGGREQFLLKALAGVDCENVGNQTDLAKLMNCSKQNVSNMMKRIRERAVEVFG